MRRVVDGPVAEIDDGVERQQLERLTGQALCACSLEGVDQRGQFRIDLEVGSGEAFERFGAGACLLVEEATGFWLVVVVAGPAGRENQSQAQQQVRSAHRSSLG